MIFQSDTNEAEWLIDWDPASNVCPGFLLSVKELTI